MKYSNNPCKYHMIQIRNKPSEVKQSLIKDVVQSRDPSASALFLHSLLVGVCLPTVKTEWHAPLLPTLQRLPTPCFSTPGPLNLPLPLPGTSLSSLFGCRDLILLASTKILLSSDAYADLCLKQAIVTSLYFLVRT